MPFLLPRRVKALKGCPIKHKPRKEMWMMTQRLVASSGAFFLQLRCDQGGICQYLPGWTGRHVLVTEFRGMALNGLF